LTGGGHPITAGMANVLSDAKRTEIEVLGRLEWSLRRIEQATGVRRETVSRYLKQAGIAVRGPGRWGRALAPKPAIEVSTDPPPLTPAPPGSLTSKPANEAAEVSTDRGAETAGAKAPGRSPTASACTPFRDYIEGRPALGRNAMAIWQDLVDEQQFAHGYASVQRFVKALKGTAPGEAFCVITTEPGEESQVDYGQGPLVRDPATGKYRRTRLFVLTLGFSRKAIFLLTFKSSSQIWAQLHEEAFRRLGGATRVVMLDNLREGVLKPDVYDPTLNPLYRDVLAHYGATAIPCRVRDPNRKGKTESAVGYGQRQLQGLRFETLADAQAYLDRWEAKWASTRIHGSTKRQVTEAFTEEQPHLRQLPTEPFRYYRYGARTVHLDGHIEVEAAYYAAPPGYLCKRVQVQWDDVHVRILDDVTGRLLIEHFRRPRGHRSTPQECLPSRTPRTTLHLLKQAELAGPNIGKLCAEIHARDSEAGIRRILGVIGMTKKHGVAAVDNACAAALDCGVANYRFVKRYVEHREPPLTLKQVDPIIRCLQHYRDLIDRRTNPSP
jgi:transposase